MEKASPELETQLVYEDTHDLVVSNIIKSHVIAGMGVSLVPVPIFDVAALTATQIKMLKSLGEHYGQTFDETKIKSLVTSLVGGSLPFFSVVGLSSLTKLVPGFGTVLGGASLSVTAGTTTYALGKVFSDHFSQGGTFDDFSVKQMKGLFQKELKNSKKIIKDIKK